MKSKIQENLSAEELKLRDTVALIALRDLIKKVPDLDQESMVKQSYAMADAMLAARKGESGGD